MSTTNLEEAATVASEFISSLENLPAEVGHLLAELKHRDTRAQELLQEIQKEGSKYVRHSLRITSSNQALSAKDTAIPSMVEAHYDEINKLCQEKELLAERIVQIVMRAKARLDCDLNRVLVLQGEGDLPVQAGYYPPVPKTSVTQVNDMLRNPPSIVELPSTPTPSGAPPMKKRRVAATASAGSIKLPSPAPAAVPASANLSAAAGQRSRLSQQVSLRNSPAARSSRRVTTPVPDANEDAEGEDDVEEDAMEEGGDQEDKELYCFCRKLSYGEMIGCDNPDCRYQWFHLPCVNLKPPLPDQWYCDECIEKFGLAPDPHSERRKSRKK